MDRPPTIVWLRRDLRLHDNPALSAAAGGGGPVIPLFILSEDFAQIGAAARWRLERALEHFGHALDQLGGRLILRSGVPGEVLQSVVRESGARRVTWNRQYDPPLCERDAPIRAQLRRDGIKVESFQANLLAEPWEVRTKAGGPYRVFAPFWASLRNREHPAPLPSPAKLRRPAVWPQGERLADWHLGCAMQRGGKVVADYALVGEDKARERLEGFLEENVIDYAKSRDRVDLDATSGLSEPLAWGEISPRLIWHAALRAMAEGRAGAEAFLRQLVWREFAWHLLYHHPDMATQNWRRDWDGFPWQADDPALTAWQRGMTGVQLVDAGMRELYTTGRMHNRARMVAASYLTKHLLIDWRAGLRWFADCLTDWDKAANALGWQWVAGSGPDAAPFFRVFNPALQAAKFDPAGRYRDRWLAERGAGHPDARAFYQAVPRRWGLSASQAYPAPVAPIEAGRAAALAAYNAFKDRDAVGPRSVSSAAKLSA